MFNLCLDVYISTHFGRGHESKKDDARGSEELEENEPVSHPPQGDEGQDGLDNQKEGQYNATEPYLGVAADPPSLG